MNGAPRVVLDTNVVLDIFHWRDPAAEPLRAALAASRIEALTDARCLEELRRVLAYPEFELAESAQSVFLTEYQRSITLIDNTTRLVPAGFPRCTDPHDQKFIELAWTSGAHYLISKDRAVLKMRRRIARLEGFAIITPTQFAELEFAN